MTPLLRDSLLVGAGGCVGAVARFLLSAWIGQRFGTAFPWATAAINVSGSFVLGLLLTLVLARLVSDPWRLLIGVGFLGAYTTFSTFEYESARLGFSWAALGNLVGSVAAGYGAVWLGITLGRLWSGRF